MLPSAKISAFAKNKNWLQLRKFLSLWNIVFAILCLILLWFMSALFGLPDLRDKTSLNTDETTRIFDRAGTTELYAIHDEKNRKPVTLQEVSPKFLLAVLAAEDDQFFAHRGYDLGGISKAICAEIGINLGSSALQKICPPRGGSTITQQLAKNILLTPEKTLRRKLREL